MLAPSRYIAWINRHLGFNPRSQANSDALSDFVVADLRAICPVINAALSSGAMASHKNATIYTKVAGRSVDLVFSQKGKAPKLIVRLSVEHKTIMTAHAKARLNRYGDIIAYSNHMHNHRRDCVAAALVAINVSPAYENPDAFARGLSRPHRDMAKVVRDTVGIFANIPLREESNEPNDQPEAVGVIVVDYDGVHPASLVSRPPAPPRQSQIHYTNFIGRICRLYGQRFSAGRSKDAPRTGR